MPAAAISAIGHDWSVRSRRPHALEVLHALQRAEPDLAATGAVTLSELFEHVSRPPASACVPHWRVTAALLRRIELDELVGVGLLAALQPGLIAVARQLDWGRGGPWPDAEAFAGDLVSTAWDVLASVAGTTVPFPERTLLRRTRQRLAGQRRASRRRLEREHLVADVELAGDEVAAVARRPGQSRAAPPETSSDVRLATLPVLDALGGALSGVAAGELPVGDVAIVYAHRVLGYSLREIAARSRLGITAVRLRSHRAEEVLCAAAW
jgi:DNA-directed RNA polymerase specialized sigma24 family protein